MACDWQALRGDPCDQFSHNFQLCPNSTNLPSCGSLATTLNTSLGGTEDITLLSWCRDNPSHFLCTAVQYGIDLDVCANTEDEPWNASARCMCQAFSGPPYECFWNQQSRVLHQFCPECAPLCRSYKYSLNFAQFLIGISLICFTIPLSRITLSLLASDALGKESQVYTCIYYWSIVDISIFSFVINQCFNVNEHFITVQLLCYYRRIHKI